MAAAIMSSAVPHYGALVETLVESGGAALATFSQPLTNLSLALEDRAALASLMEPMLAESDSGFTTQQMEAFGQFLDALGRRKSSLGALSEGDDALSRRLQSASRVFGSAKHLATDERKAPAERVIAGTLLAHDAAQRSEAMPLLAVRP